MALFVGSLRCFARSNGGLILDQYRAIIWPILAQRLLTSEEESDDVDYDADSFDSYSHSSVVSSLSENTIDPEEEDILRSHPEWHQVELDVHRTLARFPPNISDDRRSTLQCQLTPLIIRVLRTNPRFRYYQGFHDVCLTVLLVCGAKTAFDVCRSLAHRGPFRAYLLKSLEDSVLKELEFLYVILSRVDPYLEKILREIHLGTIEMPVIHQLLSTMPHELHLDAILSDSLYLASLMPPLALKSKFLQIYKQQIKTPNINREWTYLSRYAITMVAAVGIAGAAYYFNIGGRISFSI
ncbi:hypothetical protein DICVIV_02047 [Dictyocaulus viviparus]|uniref:Rab-GAP TBC domain-containing protein n=1 Tax=Dictyocaulus viviparus TaxID=29172 RepID=A0A0D8YB15_DICVI|nr:hypothetical protein DICVIV_02047 [Dictyocaulus viviparus]